MRKNPADTAVAVEFVTPELWFIANAPMRHWQRDARGVFTSTISVTAEANTKKQKSAYIAGVYAAMSELLGGVNDSPGALPSPILAAGHTCFMSRAGCALPAN